MKYYRFGFTSKTLIFALLVFFAGCAGSKSQSADETRQSEDDYIADLLGINDEENSAAGKTAPKQNTQDDDLLGLLEGENSGDKAKPMASQPVATPSNMPGTSEVKELQTKVNDLERKIQDKDRDIDRLKGQVETLEKSGQNRSAPTTAYTAPSYGSSGAATDSDYKRQYQVGYDLFQSRRYRDAVASFEALLASRSNHSLSDNAQYWIGESYYALGDYSAAVVAFEKVFTFKNSNKNDYAQYKLGQCYYQMKDFGRARQEFQTLIDNYQNSDLIGKARGYINRM